MPRLNLSFESSRICADESVVCQHREVFQFSQSAGVTGGSLNHFTQHPKALNILRSTVFSLNMPLWVFVSRNRISINCADHLTAFVVRSLLNLNADL